MKLQVVEVKECLMNIRPKRPRNEEKRKLRQAVDDALEAVNAWQKLQYVYRQKAEWICQTKGLHVSQYACSNCGRTVMDDTGYDVAKDYPFCHCGADMREGVKRWQMTHS